MKYPKIMVIYILVIFILHIIPAGVDDLSGFKILCIRLDYIIHVLVFLPWMSLMWFYLKQIETAGHSSRAKYILLWLLTGIIFAISVETIQLFIPQRSFNPVDIFFNVAGVVIGAVIYFWKPKSQT